MSSSMNDPVTFRRDLIPRARSLITERCQLGVTTYRGASFDLGFWVNRIRITIGYFGKDGTAVHAERQSWSLTWLAWFVKRRSTMLKTHTEPMEVFNCGVWTRLGYSYL